jgi:hypothetical protein
MLLRYGCASFRRALSGQIRDSETVERSHLPKSAGFPCFLRRFWAIIASRLLSGTVSDEPFR